MVAEMVLGNGQLDGSVAVPYEAETPPNGRTTPIPPVDPAREQRESSLFGETPKRRGRKPKSAPSEQQIKRILASAFTTSNFALRVTGYQRHELTSYEIQALVDAWTEVVLMYPETSYWFTAGNRVTVWANATIVTISVLVPRFAGIDLSKPVRFGRKKPDGSANATENAETGTGIPENSPTEYPDTAGSTQSVSGDNGLWKDNPSQIIIAE
jgi:hypothetical protein